MWLGLVLIVASAALRESLGDLTGASEAYLYLSTETRVHEIAVGALVALLVSGSPASGVAETVRRAARAPVAAGALVAVALTLFYTFPFDSTVRAVATVVVILFVVARNGTGLVGRFFDSAPLRFVSLISFSVFTWHLYGLDFDGLLGFLPFAARVPIVVAITLCVGAGMYLALEYLPRRWARRLQ